MNNTKITKIISVIMSTLLIAAMLTAVSVSVSAATPDEAAPLYYNIIVREIIDDVEIAVPSLISVSTEKVRAGSDETVTINEDYVPIGYKLISVSYFGEFDTVGGNADSEDADATLVLKPKSDIIIEARYYSTDDEPEEDEFEDYDPDYYSELPPVSGPDIYCAHDGSGKVDYKDKLMDINGDGYFDIMETGEGFIWIKNVTYTAVPDGADFVRWEFDGDCELISGSLTDPEIVVRPMSTYLSGTAIFADSPTLAHKPIDKPIDKPKATPDQKLSASGGSGSATSPKTRDMLPLFAVITLSAVFAGCFAVIKLKEK